MNHYRIVLRDRRLSLLLFGDLVSKLGDGMLMVVLPLLALRIHGSLSAATAVSLTVAAPFLLSLPLGLKVGLGAARFDPRKVVLADCVVRSVAMAGLAVLALQEDLSFWVLFTVLLCGSTLRSVSAAARRVMATARVDETKRLAVNSVMGVSDSTAMFIVGPSVGGILIVVAGPWLPLLLDASSYVLLIVAALAMPRVERQPTSADGFPRSGWQTMRSTSGLWYLFFVAFAYNMLWGPVEVVLPLFISEDMASSEAVYGYLMTCLGVGAVVGSFLAGFLARFPPWRVLIVLVIAWGGSLTVVATASDIAVVMVAICVGGLVWAPFIPVMFTVVQKHVPDEEHQNVLTFWGSGYNLAGPLGILLGAPVVALAGTRGTMVLSGLLTIALAVPALFAERRMFARGELHRVEGEG